MGLEGELEKMSFEMTTEISLTGTCTFGKLEGESSKFLGPATLKLWAPSKVQTNETDSKLVLDNLRERVK